MAIFIAIQFFLLILVFIILIIIGLEVADIRLLITYLLTKIHPEDIKINLEIIYSYYKNEVLNYILEKNVYNSEILGVTFEAETKEEEEELKSLDKTMDGIKFRKSVFLNTLNNKYHNIISSNLCKKDKKFNLANLKEKLSSFRNKNFGRILHLRLILIPIVVVLIIMVLIGSVFFLVKMKSQIIEDNTNIKKYATSMFSCANAFHFTTLELTHTKPSQNTLNFHNEMKKCMKKNYFQFLDRFLNDKIMASSYEPRIILDDLPVVDLKDKFDFSGIGEERDIEFVSNKNFKSIYISFIQLNDMLMELYDKPETIMKDMVKRTETNIFNSLVIIEGVLYDIFEDIIERNKTAKRYFHRTYNFVSYLYFAISFYFIYYVIFRLKKNVSDEIYYSKNILSFMKIEYMQKSDDFVDTLKSDLVKHLYKA